MQSAVKGPQVIMEPHGIRQELFAKLDDLPGGYAIYKNVESIAKGLEGRSDLDVLVDAQCWPALRSTLISFGGFRGHSHKLYDNAIPEREDWFVPVDGAGLLHFDIAHAIMAGPKFSKRYPTFLLDDLQTVRAEQRGLQLPVVHPRERAQIALVRFAFKLRLHPWFRSWIKTDCELATALGAAIGDQTSESVLLIKFRAVEAPVRIKRDADCLKVDVVSLSGLRRTIRRAHNMGRFAPILETTHHFLRKGIFALYRKTGMLYRSHPVDKRRLAPGCIVALIGPDGVGKSTQAGRLLEAFGHKVRCRSVYLGSNDGSWMKFRRCLDRADKEVVNALPRNVRPRTKHTGARGWAHATSSAAWRLLIGVRRFLVVRQSLRLARAGTLVITDRWPQSLAEGMLDGPSRSPPARYRLASAMWRIEKRIYNRLSRHKPDLAVHLVAPFAVSQERKPGDIKRDDFEDRITLMHQMRARDPSASVVDAGQSLDAVTEQVFNLICQHLGRAY